MALLTYAVAWLAAFTPAGPYAARATSPSFVAFQDPRTTILGGAVEGSDTGDGRREVGLHPAATGA